MRKKGSIFILLMVVATLLLLSGCAAQEKNIEETQPTVELEKMDVFTTLYAQYDFSTKIGGEHVNVIKMIPPGVSPHDYEPTPKDIAALVNGDLFVYNGAGLEGWVEKVIENLEGKDLKIVNASEHIDLIEGSHQHHDEDGDEHDEDGDEHEEHGDEDEHELAMDPHVWLDPMNALKQAEEIKNALVELDAANANDYEANYQALKEQLIALDNQYKEELKNVKRKEFFVSHAAFGYLAKKYDLTQQSISGIIPADEPSPSELAEIIDHAKELNIKYILLDPRDVTKISEMVASEIGAKTALINPAGNVSKEQIEKGIDYIKIMKMNLDTLKMALNE